MTSEPSVAEPTTAKLNPKIVGDSVFLDREECLALGKQLHDTYVNNTPFPHIVIDDLFPAEPLRRVVEEFPGRREGRFSDAHSKLKTGYQMEMIDSPYIHNLLAALNSAQFLGFLEEMTGIKGLIPDPHFLGGGLHETKRGGHLSVHVDFNVHRPLQLRRRMNLILFLNENWEEEWGGTLELWETDMSKRVHAVLPHMGRAVVFNTDPGSYHGHPDPLNTPDDVLRRSIALYYYTAPEGGVLPAERTTEFRARPGTGDKGASKSLTMKQFVRDLTPPLIMRALKGKKK